MPACARRAASSASSVATTPEGPKSSAWLDDTEQPSNPASARSAASSLGARNAGLASRAPRPRGRASPRGGRSRASAARTCAAIGASIGEKSYPSPDRAACHTGEWIKTSPPNTNVARRGGAVVVVVGGAVEVVVDDADAGGVAAARSGSSRSSARAPPMPVAMTARRCRARPSAACSGDPPGPRPVCDVGAAACDPPSVQRIAGRLRGVADVLLDSVRVHVLMTNHHLDRPAGTETYVLTIAGELCRRGHRVTCYAAVLGETRRSPARDRGVDHRRPEHDRRARRHPRQPHRRHPRDDGCVAAGADGVRLARLGAAGGAGAAAPRALAGRAVGRGRASGCAASSPHATGSRSQRSRWSATRSTSSASGPSSRLGTRRASHCCSATTTSLRSAG